MDKNLFLALCFLFICTLAIGPMQVKGNYFSNMNNSNSVLCSLTIDRVLVGDCEYGPRTGGLSKVIVIVFLSWIDPNPGEQISVQINGIQKFHDPFSKGCPSFVQFVLDPDGGRYTIDAAFTSGNCRATQVNVQLPLPCDPPVCMGSQAIGGKVYFDYNNNGIQESSENGIRDIEVRLYDDAKQLHAITTSGTNGLWAVDNLLNGQNLRVEYQIPAGLFDAKPGIENKTRTQRAAVGNCRVDLGIFQLQDLIDPNPWVVSTCFAKGDALNPASPAFNEPSIVANLYSTTEGGPRTGPNGNYYLASAGETGSVWGLCFQKETRKLFSGAFLKRNASLGPGGLGAIYVTDLNSFLPTPPVVPAYRYYNNTTLLLNLDSFGIQTGDESLLIRNLPVNPFQASHDSISFEKIGKWGLGDLDLNDAGDTLFVVNLFNRSLITIAIGNPLNLPITANRIQEITIPDPGCAATSDWRPWGLKYKDGAVYVGGVCSAESSSDQADLKEIVYSYSNGIFSSRVNIDLNYKKGFLEGNNCSTFRPWNHDFYYYHITRDIVCGPVPVLSDIEFDSEDNMIVSIGDRYGYQSGGRDYGTNTRDGLRYITFAGGDNLKLFRLKGEYLLEKNATSGFYTTAGANNNQGICGGEFYFQDGFYSHQESVLGALAAHPSYNTILATLMDPASIWSNGWSQLDNSLGTKKVNYNIFTGENGTFGKAAGLGDIELLIGSSTPKGIGVSIGNYIWNDTDQDGIQDPGEPAMKNVPILLFNQRDSLIAQTLSDTNGIYTFLDLDPYTEYIIQVGADTNYFNNNFSFRNKVYATTSFQSKLNFGNAENDSDASQTLPLPIVYQNKIALNYLTGKDGENNFSLDFGLLDCALSITDTARYDLCILDSVLVGNTWFSKSNPAGIVKFPNRLGYGCDSLVQVQATFHVASQSALDTSVCEGSNLILHNQVFDEQNPSGLILLFGANQFGCDSSIQLNLSFRKRTEFNLDTSICPNGKIVLHNETFDLNRLSGDIVLREMNSSGCDSTIHVSLNVLPVSIADVDTVVCNGSSVVLHNKLFDESNPKGQIVLKAANQFACDSIINVNLRFHPQLVSKIDTAICAGAYILLHQQRFDEQNPSGRIILPGGNSMGCDSLIEVNLSIRPSAYSQLDTAVCPGEQIIIHQKVFDEFNRNGMIVLNQLNQFGCDSTIFVNLRIRPEYHFLDSVESCGEYTWPINGMRYTQSGTYLYDATTKEFCDSIHELKLVVHPEYQIVDSICTLNRFIWPADQQEYQKSGVYSFNHRTSKGCDSIEFLVLIIAYVGEVYVPNVFSPNGDNINDRVFVFANEDVHEIEVFEIFNRWGERVFDRSHFLPNDSRYGWDGVFKNENANPAVFVYRVVWRDKLGGKHQMVGDVTLVR